ATPFDWLKTLAVPSAKSSTSPASTSFTALSMRPRHSGSFAVACAAMSETAARQVARGGVSRCTSDSISVTVLMGHLLGPCYGWVGDPEPPGVSPPRGSLLRGLPWFFCLLRFPLLHDPIDVGLLDGGIPRLVALLFLLGPGYMAMLHRVLLA